MTDAFETLKKSIKSLAEEKKYATLRDILTTMNAADVASLFEDIPEETVPLLYRLLPKELAADTFVEMEPDTQHMLIKGFSDTELKEVVDELYVDDAVDLVEEMPANVVKRILIQADAEKRKMINTILQYPDDSAGSIMTTEFVELRPKMTAEEAILHLRRSGINKETINNCYICAKGRQLMGVVTIRDLIMASSEETMEDLMEENIISVSTLEDQETVARQFSKYGFLAMPVVDREERLVGIVTIDDVLDVMEEETTEDIEKMAAIVPADKPYLKQTTFDLWKSRMPWLLLLMISATFTGFIITSFEDALSKYVVLTAYIPMLMDTGGNSGSQASVTVIRGISLKEVEFRDIFRVIWKEFRVAVLVALSVGVVCFAKLQLIDRLIFGYEYTLLYALAIAVAITLAVIVAKIVGCCIPILAKTLHIDPAVFANPFITTISDVLSLLIFCGVTLGLFHLGLA